jgi:hypothetical protein
VLAELDREATLPAGLLLIGVRPTPAQQGQDELTFAQVQRELRELTDSMRSSGARPCNA